MYATIELKCNKVHGYSMKAAMEIKIQLKVSIRGCECENMSIIRIKSKYAMNSLKVLKFIFYKYMHTGVEFKMKNVEGVFTIECSTNKEGLIHVHELTEKLRQLKEKCNYETRIVHLLWKTCDMHMYHE